MYLSNGGQGDDVGAEVALNQKDELNNDGEDCVGHRHRQTVHQPRTARGRLLKGNICYIRKPEIVKIRQIKLRWTSIKPGKHWKWMWIRGVDEAQSQQPYFLSNCMVYLFRLMICLLSVSSKIRRSVVNLSGLLLNAVTKVVKGCLRTKDTIFAM